MKKSNSPFSGKILLTVAVIAVLGAGTVLVLGDLSKHSGDHSYYDQKFVWTAPTTGTPVHHYVAQLLNVSSQDTQVFDPVPSEEIVVELRYGNEYQLRVAGVDAANIQGPWSIMSPVVYNDTTDPAPLPQK